MNYILIFLIEVILLFFSSRLLTKSLSFLPINLISIIFLPGIIIHELSHLLLAGILFVKAGEIEFMPKMEDRSVKLGSVTIARSDPIRRFLIGISPIIFGILVIALVLNFIRTLTSPLYFNFLIFYVLFVVGNTMFSSKKDMEGGFIPLILMVIFLTAFYFTGVRIPQQFFTTVSSKASILSQINYFLPFVIILDFVIYLLGKKVRS